MSKKLVRFDWAMKKLLRNKANFEVLEGFLSELINRDVKIQQILESESNRASATDKQNRVDLLTEIDSGELVLIELQVESQYDYFHRMAYGTSKLITDNMDSGFDYDKVRRVISVNILYFELGHGEDYIYKGINEFKGIHKNDILNLSTTQQEKFPTLQKVSDIFPEYYILKVNGFDNIAKDTLDEWIYFLKNSDIKSEFKAKGLQKASEVLDVMKLSDADRAVYQDYIEDRRIAESSIKTSWFEGHQKGIEKGIEKGKIDIALNLLKAGVAIEIIEQSTGLTAKEIEGLTKG